MAFIEVSKAFSEKQMRFMEVKSSDMEENGLRIHSHGIESIFIERLLPSPRVGISDNPNTAGLENCMTKVLLCNYHYASPFTVKVSTVVILHLFHH